MVILVCVISVGFVPSCVYVSVSCIVLVIHVCGCDSAWFVDSTLFDS